MHEEPPPRRRKAVAEAHVGPVAGLGDREQRPGLAVGVELVQVEVIKGACRRRRGGEAEIFSGGRLNRAQAEAALRTRWAASPGSSDARGKSARPTAPVYHYVCR
jgi:hypothetical protein